jgi:hypothetical protein
MTHSEFIHAYGARRVRVEIDPAAAAAARLDNVPLVMLPVLGCGVALALTGWIWSGLAVIAMGIIAPRMIKRSAPHFVLTQALQDEKIYQEVTSAHILRVAPLP